MSTLFEELSRVKTYEYTEEDVVRFEALHEEIRALWPQSDTPAPRCALRPGGTGGGRGHR